MSTFQQAQERLDFVLRPNKPIDTESLLAGRSEQLQDVTTAIRLSGAHALVYGDRGVGKTSLAATAQSLQLGSVAVRVNCAPDTDWVSIWESVAAEISSNYLSGQHRIPASNADLEQALEALDRGILNVAQAIPPLRQLGSLFQH